MYDPGFFTEADKARGKMTERADVEKILRAKTTEIEPRLGYKSLDEVVHRDDLVVL